jgi:hypothetical protein
MRMRYTGQQNILCKAVMAFEKEGNCIVCLEMRADKLMRHLISDELTKHRVVRTSPKSLQKQIPCTILYPLNGTQSCRLVHHEHVPEALRAKSQPIFVDTLQ